ncbi:MAG: ParB N-terminal domain-containing protein [Candidatus Omnitrophica bacterium]|nr:ParB N-terminal domain-containing protein [Candidatus Omnitrophota bacterium]
MKSKRKNSRGKTPRKRNRSNRTKGKRTMATEYGQFTNARVIRSEIHVDPELNSRKTVDPKKIDKLAQSIKAQGQIHPCLLIRSAQLGEKYDAEGRPYVLVCGFRRQAALDINAESAGLAEDKTEADYRIAPIEWTIQDAITANLTENLAREDLTTYELAAQCVELRDQFGMAAKDIAGKVRAHDCEQGDKKPLSEAHINNLMRCATSLHEEILKAWQEQHPRASLRVLIQLAAEKDEETQLKIWRGVEHPEEAGEEEGGEGGEGEGGGKGDKEPPQRRPTSAQLTIMIEAVKAAVKNEKRDPEFGKGAIAALRYAAGLASGIPGVKLGTEEAQE